MLATTIVAGGCMALSLALHQGIPAYRHDWQWPLDQASFAPWFLAKLDAWNWQSFGQPNIAIQVHPFFALNVLAAIVFPSKLILIAWLAAAAAVSAAGAGVFAATTFQVRAFPAILTGVLYGLSPLIVNKTVAGHIPYLLASAAIPWLLLAMSWRHRAAPWSLGLLLAWAGLQIQVVIFGLVLAVTTPFRRFAFKDLTALALALGSLLPYFWALLRHEGGAVTAAMQTSVPWETAQSVPLADAARGIGYFAQYWETASAPVVGAVALPWLYPAGMVLALMVRRDVRVWMLAAAYALGVLLLSGLKGPLAAPLSYLFGHVPAASAFRELYDAGILVSFPGAVGMGVALNAVPAVRVQAAVTIAVCAVAVTPWLSGAVLGQTGSAVLTPSIRQTIRQIAGVAQPSKFYVAPGANPVGPRQSAVGGADPAVFNAGNSYPFWVYLVRGQEGAVIWALQHGGAEAATVAKALGISAMLTQPDLATKFGALTISGRDLKISEFSGALRPIPDWAQSRGGPANLLLPTGSQKGILRLVRAPVPASEISSVGDDIIIQSTHGSPIDTGWAPAQDWWFLSDKVAQAAPEGAVTSARNTRLISHCYGGRATADLYAAGAGSVGNQEIATDRWTKVRVACESAVPTSALPHGFIVVTSVRRVEAWRSIMALGRLPDSPLQVRKSGDELVATATTACNRCTLILSERASPGWVLSVRGEEKAPTALAAGFAAWSVDMAGGQVVRAVYRPARVAFLLESLAIFCWVCLLAGFVTGLRFPRTETPPVV